MKAPVRAKICGMQCAEDIELAVKFGADAVGFITEVPVDSPRKLDAATASSLILQVPVFVDSVLVIMPENGEEAVELIDICKPDIVQLHNDLVFSDLKYIRDNVHQKIVKTFSIPAGKQNTMKEILPAIGTIEELFENDLIDGILLDSSKAGQSGGTGVVHDWSVSRQIVERIEAPVILAGGLNPENVRRAVEEVRPYAVDVASGVEKNGKKDPDKVSRFITQIRCANG
jgi:phosphoribosylanthranilate isomerase